jgi:hypothetical protein
MFVGGHGGHCKRPGGAGGASAISPDRCKARSNHVIIIRI